MENKRTPEKQGIQLIESEAVSWWSWRPGMKPLYAFLFGGLLSLLALFLLSNGATLLISGMLDSNSPPLRAPGIVTGHTRNVLGSPQLTIRLEEPGLPPEITLIVSPVTSATLSNGTPVTVDYAPHLRTPYALESQGHRSMLPGTSASGNLLATLALLLFGLVLLPYPFLLSFWGWRDLRTPQGCKLTAYVVALRTAKQTTTRTPGLVRRTTHIWYGVALQPANETTTAAKPTVLTFGLKQEVYERLQRGDKVQVIYSPHLHHLYTLKYLETE